jgi:hypothetical protein
MKDELGKTIGGSLKQFYFEGSKHALESLLTVIESNEDATRDYIIRLLKKVLKDKLYETM